MKVFENRVTRIISAANNEVVRGWEMNYTMKSLNIRGLSNRLFSLPLSACMASSVTALLTFTVVFTLNTFLEVKHQEG
jgi:hypothetical protein